MTDFRVNLHKEQFALNLFPANQGSIRTIADNGATFESLDVTPILNSRNANTQTPANLFDVSLVSFGDTQTTDFFLYHRAVLVPNRENAPTPGDDLMFFQTNFITAGPFVAFKAVPGRTVHGGVIYDIFLLVTDMTVMTQHDLAVFELDKAPTDATAEIIGSTDETFNGSQVIERKRSPVVTYNAFIMLS